MSVSTPLRIFNRYRETVMPVKKLRGITAALYEHKQLPLSRSINLVCCSEYLIRKLNRTWRGIDKVTDVLSFHFDDADLLGEIYISLHRCRVQARRFFVSFDDEFLRLYAHGLCHLAGHTHAGTKDRTVMEALEHQLLAGQNTHPR